MTIAMRPDRSRSTTTAGATTSGCTRRTSLRCARWSDRPSSDAGSSASRSVSQDRTSDLNVPGAVIGAVIGGVLGHQVGSGSGNTVATVGGAVAGGAVGSQVGRIGGGEQQAQTRDVQRCENVPSQARPDHWDVTYNFRGQEHRMQMTHPRDLQ